MHSQKKLEAILEAHIDPSLKETLQLTSEEFDRATAVKSTLRTEGGRILLSSLKGDCGELISELIRRHTAPDVNLVQLTSLIAALDAKLKLYNALRNAPGEARSLSEALEDTMQELLGDDEDALSDE